MDLEGGGGAEFVFLSYNGTYQDSDVSESDLSSPEVRTENKQDWKNPGESDKIHLFHIEGYKQDMMTVAA